MSLKFLILFTIFIQSAYLVRHAKGQSSQNMTEKRLTAFEKILKITQAFGVNTRSSCTPYVIKSGDSLWNLSNDWCKDGNGWKSHIFLDSNCSSNISSPNIHPDDKIYFGEGCTDPNANNNEDLESDSDHEDLTNDNCTEYTIEQDDGLWDLSEAWCKDGNGWKNHIFTDSECTSNLSSPDINLGDKIYFGEGCHKPNNNDATPISGDNVFISYISPKDIYNTTNSSKKFLAKNNTPNDLGSYVKQKGLQGAMMWEISGDFPISNPLSLKKAMLNHPGFNGKVTGFYWANWDMYLESHAIPMPSKAIDAFQEDFSALSNAGRSVYVYYAFMETISVIDEQAGITENDLGTLYFFDPWSDLSPENCNNDSLTDTYVMKVKKDAAIENTCENATKYNNFYKFAHLSNAERFISIGGYSYDKTFEVMFNNGALNQKASDNFVKSAADLIKRSRIDGIDLDYEDLTMTNEMSQSYLALVKKLRKYFNDNGLQDKKIQLTILSDPKYIKGVRGGQYGFSNLSEFEPYIDSLQLMTYDFHGAFDFGQGGFNKTGFLSNLYASNDQAPNFSVAGSVEASLQLGIPQSKIIAGIPAYGRSVANINNSLGTHGVKGLGQGIIEGKSLALVAGDMDEKDCNKQDAKYPCSGMFSYQYIVNNLLKNGFKGKEAIAPEMGSAAYAEHWEISAAPETCTEYTIKNDDGLWDLSNAWCMDGTGWKTHIFTDSECKSNIKTPNISAGDKIYFGTGCQSPQ